jgi:hypothetical protein
MSLDLEIRTWIDNRGSFASGTDMYRRAGGGALLSVFQAECRKAFIGPGMYERLKEALLPLASAAPEDRVYLPPPTTPSEPDSVADLRAQGKSWKKRESFIHAQLVTTSQLPPSPEREKKLLELATELMEEITPELDRIYDSIREFERTGKAPLSNEAQIVKDTVLKFKKRDSVGTLVYRIRARLAKPGITQEEATSLRAQLADKEAEWAALDKELHIADDEE